MNNSKHKSNIELTTKSNSKEKHCRVSKILEARMPPQTMITQMKNNLSSRNNDNEIVSMGSNESHFHSQTSSSSQTKRVFKKLEITTTHTSIGSQKQQIPQTVTVRQQPMSTKNLTKRTSRNNVQQSLMSVDNKENKTISFKHQKEALKTNKSREMLRSTSRRRIDIYDFMSS